VTIKDIHIRYEDQVTHIGSPFALGLTLSQLTLESTDGKGKPANAQQITSVFHKVFHPFFFFFFFTNLRRFLFADTYSWGPCLLLECQYPSLFKSRWLDQVATIYEGNCYQGTISSRLHIQYVHDSRKLKKFLLFFFFFFNIFAVFGPISAGAKLQMNLKPEMDDFKIPKINLEMDMDVLSVGM
jgi:hypothetical protein